MVKRRHIGFGVLGIIPLTLFAQQAEKPNVLFIAVDDLNDWAACLGGYQGTIHTPNLDRLASQGVLFTKAYCSVPSSAPSRASVLTGISAPNSGMYLNEQHWRQVPALAEAITIPEYFRENGYTVKGGGKIFHALSWLTHELNYTGQVDGDNDPKCWDDYYPSLQRSMPDAILPEEWQQNQPSEGRPFPYFAWGALPDDRTEEMSDYRVVDWAISELQKPHDKPFFLGVGIYKPHIPWFVPQKYFDLYPLDSIVLPRVRPDDMTDLKSHRREHWHQWILDNDLWTEAVQGYLASITFCDEQVGRLLDALEKSGRAGNTIVVLWSDHGFHLGEKYNWEKFTLWEEATRVTFMLKAAGTESAKVETPVSLLDIYPTLNELCGFAPKENLDGLSLVPQLTDPEAGIDRKVVMTWKYNCHAIRSDRYRYIRYDDGFEELYDHAVDPDEFVNLVYDTEGKQRYVAVLDEHRLALPVYNEPQGEVKYIIIE